MRKQKDKNNNKDNITYSRLLEIIDEARKK